ncbi:hypothetical protein [Streptomyces coelicoflavus]|uniref:hypothetical protein n=1 Tax=Streptomyces coelicoflavus TaxID=285562 RepID=UPI0036B0FAB3
MGAEAGLGRGPGQLGPTARGQPQYGPLLSVPVPDELPVGERGGLVFVGQDRHAQPTDDEEGEADSG